MLYALKFNCTTCHTAVYTTSGYCSHRVCDKLWNKMSCIMLIRTMNIQVSHRCPYFPIVTQNCLWMIPSWN